MYIILLSCAIVIASFLGIIIWQRCHIRRLVKQRDQCVRQGLAALAGAVSTNISAALRDAALRSEDPRVQDAIDRLSYVVTADGPDTLVVVLQLDDDEAQIRYGSENNDPSDELEGCMSSMIMRSIARRSSSEH